MAIVKVHLSRAVLGTPKASLPLLAFAERVEQKVGASSSFPGAGQVLADLAAARTAFSRALAIKGVQKNTGDACAAARQGVIDALHHVKDHVNGVAEKASPDQAKAIIESAGFRTRKVAIPVKLPLDAKYGGVAGAVLLVAAAGGKKAIYYFQVSTDQRSWSSCPNTMKCKTLVTGLTVGTICYFRVQVQTHKETRDWTMPVSFVVR